jgi:hypothetical protein
MFHVFPICPALLPEARAAANEMVRAIIQMAGATV